MVVRGYIGGCKIGRFWLKQEVMNLQDMVKDFSDEIFDKVFNQRMAWLVSEEVFGYIRLSITEWHGW